MRNLELLAPAKNLECGIAAINHGADAVYIGASQFGARAAAGNDIEDIRQLCQYAHRYSARVYVTVNTILYDDELDATLQLIRNLYNASVDGLLIQDMGVLQMQLPPIELHASTQTDNRTADKVRWLRSLGFKRIVLARELSAKEIAVIHEAVPDIELEVFVHGALCVSYSGQCYASQHLCGRSANRGQCAQVCRMQFDLVDSDGRELIHQRHLLSLKDLNQSHHLEELIEAGATSFKIEGRLKDVTYVKNVVAAYSRQLNNIVHLHPDLYQRSSRGCSHHTFTPNLDKTFNRGFTTYFLRGRQQGIFSPDTPKAIGEYVGTVKEMRRDSFNVAGTATFANGDGLCFFAVSTTDGERQLEGFRINRAEGNRLYPQQMPRNLRAGMALYRNHDMEMERQLSRPSAERKIPVTMYLAATSDGFSLSSDLTSAITVSVNAPHEQAQKPQYDNILRQLSRLGGTAYECADLKVQPDFNYFIPASLLSDLRRRLVEAMDNHLSTTPIHHTPTTAAPEGPTSIADTTTSQEPPHYPIPYLYNIANQLSRQFYDADTLTAYELRGGDGPLMQCRHCLRFELGYCVKHGGKQSKWREPLFLRLADGRRLRLEFDCKHCQMNVYAVR